VLHKNVICLHDSHIPGYFTFCDGTIYNAPKPGVMAIERNK